jgi:hypothetical protein
MDDYSKIEKFLHYIALQYPIVTDFSFDLEKFFFPCNNLIDSIYITGLARSGTTILLNSLYQTGEFASLTYKDMPFVLAPNSWEKINSINFKSIPSRERSHEDGLMVSVESPEAFEEVFWRSQCGKLYISTNKLMIHNVDNNIVKSLLKLQNLVCHKYQKKRYLDKNNNHILRVHELSRKLNNTKFLIMLRKPYNQVGSIINQHQKFLKNDRFSHLYMNWLVHHEFGTTHKPFELFPLKKIEDTPENINYWLDRWIETYSYILALTKKGLSNSIIISYEKLCNQEDYWKNLLLKLNLPLSQSPFKMSDSVKKFNFNTSKLKKAENIYNELSKFSSLENFS